MHGNAMASKRLSPSAQLLRRSRLFSLPPALPHPAAEQSGVRTTFESDSATLRYPIHASIETTPPALARGDWGLKRPLPLKSTTNTSTPIVRVKEVDNADHITNYESAADHTLTLQKLQEMNVPVQRYHASTMEELFNRPLGSGGQSSVFDVYERIPPHPKDDSRPSRWKFKGPWIGGMDDVEFEKYLGREVKKRRVEFRNYLRKAILEEKVEKAAARARDKGEDFNEASVTLTEEDFQTEIIRMRQKREDLMRHLARFLDLPSPLIDSNLSHGPPVTHPSAGLSYLRTNAHLHNHPLLGPQATSPPVRSRVLQRSSTSSRKTNRGGLLIGVGGIVATAQSGVVSGIFQNRSGNEASFETFGGEKGWVNPESAAIDSQGRIILDVKAATQDSMAIWEKVYPKPTDEEKTQEKDINVHMKSDIINPLIAGRTRGPDALPSTSISRYSSR